MPKPRAKVVAQVCTLCGLDWELHGPDPDAAGCVKLLLDEVARLRLTQLTRPAVIGYPVPVKPWPVPYYPQWYSQLASSTGGIAASSRVTNAASYAAPAPAPLALTKGRMV